jgi:hypothetical protein
MSTRPVRIAGEDHTTRFTEGAMEHAIEQVRHMFVPVGIEHLDFLPPWGRVYDGEIVEASDGEKDLVMKARELPQFEWSGIDIQIDAIVADLPEHEPVEVDINVGFEKRNFSADALHELEANAPVTLHEQTKWAVLPPIAFAILIPVLWGSVKFAGAFCEQLGQSAAQALVAWLKKAADTSLEPERDRSYTIGFDLGEQKTVDGFILIQHDDPEGEQKLAQAFEASHVLAAFAGYQKETEFLPNLARASFIFDQGSWKLAWWTDGDCVYRSSWYQVNSPSAARFLGRPPLDFPNGSREE